MDDLTADNVPMDAASLGNILPNTYNAQKRLLRTPTDYKDLFSKDILSMDMPEEQRAVYDSEKGRAYNEKVKAYEFWRSRYGRDFFRYNDREMNDQEVDFAIRQAYGYDNKETINFEEMNKRTEMEWNDITGDLEDFNLGTEGVKGGFAELIKTGEILTEEAAQLGVGAFNFFSPTRFKSFEATQTKYNVDGKKLYYNDFALDDQEGDIQLKDLTPAQVREISSEFDNPKRFLDYYSKAIKDYEDYQARKSTQKDAIENTVDFLTDGMEKDIFELSQYAGQEDVNFFGQGLALVFQNSPTLLAGFARGYKGILLSAFTMFAREKDAMEKELMDMMNYIPGATRDEFKTDEDYFNNIEKRSLIQRYSNFYGLASGVVEYMESRTFANALKGMGNKSVFIRNKRAVYTNLKGIAKEMGINMGETVGQELGQEAINVGLYNKAVDEAKMFGVDAEKKSVEYLSTIKAASAMGFWINIAGGGGKKIIDSGNFIKSRMNMLMDIGFSKNDATEIAWNMSRINNDPKASYEYAQKIYERWTKIDLSTRVKSTNRAEKELLPNKDGMYTVDGEGLMGVDFDRLRVTHSDEELSTMITNPEMKQTFIDAVNGNENARKEYNKAIYGDVRADFRAAMEAETDRQNTVEDTPFKKGNRAKVGNKTVTIQEAKFNNKGELISIRDENGVVYKASEVKIVGKYETQKQLSKKFKLSKINQKLVKDINNGLKDDEIIKQNQEEIDSGEMTIEEARADLIRKVYNTAGQKIPLPNLSDKEVRSQAKKMGIPTSGKGRTIMFIRQELERAKQEKKKPKRLTDEQIEVERKRLGIRGYRGKGNKGRTKQDVRNEVEEFLAVDLAEENTRRMGRDLKGRFRKRTGKEVFAQEIMWKMLRSLKIIAPDVRIVVAKNSQNFVDITGNNFPGYYDHTRNTIFLNPDKIDAETLYHEAVHAIFRNKFRSDARIRYAANQILNNLLKSQIPPGLSQRIRQFQARYVIYSRDLTDQGRVDEAQEIINDLDEEGIAELVAIITEGYKLSPSKSLKEKIINWFYKIFGNFVPMSNERQAVMMMETIANKFVRGETITSGDISLLDKLNDQMDDMNLQADYVSPMGTIYQRGKFRRILSDEETGLTFTYDVADKDWENLTFRGKIRKDTPLSYFNGMKIHLHTPDDLFTGKIEDGEGNLLVQGDGGIFYTIKYNDDGTFWASTELAAKALANSLNKISKLNGGTILMALNSSPRGKTKSSTTGSRAYLKLINNLVTSGVIPESMFNKAIKVASKSLSTSIQNPKDKRGKRLIKYHFPKGTTDINKIIEVLDIDQTTFGNRKIFVEQMFIEIQKQVQDSNKKVTNRKVYNALLKFANNIQAIQPESGKTNINLAKDHGIASVLNRVMPELLAEPILKNMIGSDNSIDNLINIIRANLTPDLLTPAQRKLLTKDSNPETGHCYVATETLYYLLGGKDSGYTPKRAKDDLGNNHYFLQDEAGNIIDVTENQYLDRNVKPPYDNITASGDGVFQLRYKNGKPTAAVSQRTQKLLDKIKNIQGLHPNSMLNRNSGGQIYAMIEMQGEVEAVLDTRHESYNYVIRSKKSSTGVNNKATLHILNDRQSWQDSLVQEDGTALPTDASGISKLVYNRSESKVPLQVNAKSPGRTPTNFVPTERKTILFASFFSGGGTLEMGFGSNDRIQVVCANEYDESIVDQYNKTHGTDYQAVNILDLNPQDLVDQGIESIHLSPPCQAFSGSNAKFRMELDNIKDPAAKQKLKQRNQKLYDHEIKIAKKVAEIISVVQPTSMTIENVADYVKSEQFQEHIAPVLNEIYGREGEGWDANIFQSHRLGGNTRRRRAIIRASMYKLPALPEETGAGNWLEAIQDFIPAAPVNEFFTSGQSKSKAFNNFLRRVLDPNFKDYSPEAVYIEPDSDPNSDGASYKPSKTVDGKNIPCNALLAKLQFGKGGKEAGLPQMSKQFPGQISGSGSYGQVCLPVTTRLIKKYGKRKLAKKYGCTIDHINMAHGGTGFVVKTFTTEIMLALMNLDPNLASQMGKHTQLHRLILGNGMTGNMVREIVEPVILQSERGKPKKPHGKQKGKARIDEEFVQNLLDTAEYEGIEAAREELRQEVDPRAKYEGLSFEELRADARRRGFTGRSYESLISRLVDDDLLYQEVDPASYDDVIVDEELEQSSTSWDDLNYSVEDFRDEYYDGSYLEPGEETINPEGRTLLTMESIRTIMEGLGLRYEEPNTVRRIATIIFEAKADMADGNNVALDLAMETIAAAQQTGTAKLLSDKQHAILVVRMAELSNDLQTVKDQILAQGGADFEALIDKREQILNEISTIANASKLTGTEIGRALNARRLMLAQDYSFAGMYTRAETAAKKELSQDTIKDLEQLAASIKEIESDIANKEREITETEETAIRKEAEEVIKKSRGRPKGSKNKVQKTKDRIEQEAKSKPKKKSTKKKGKGRIQFTITERKLAIDVRDMAKSYAADGYTDINYIVSQIQNFYSSIYPPDSVEANMTEFDVLGCISGRLTRKARQESEAIKRLKVLAQEANLLIQVENALQGYFDPRKEKRPKKETTIILRKKLEELKKLARQSEVDDARIQRLEQNIRNIDDMLDGLYRPVKKLTKKRSERVDAVYKKLQTQKKALAAQDRLLLLQAVLEYGDAPPSNPKVVNVDTSNERLNKLRAEIAVLEKQIRERNKIEANKKRQEALRKQQEETLERLTNEVLGWYRLNVQPRKSERSDIQVSIAEQRRLQRQQDRIGELTEILRTGKLPSRPKQIESAEGFKDQIQELSEQIKETEWMKALTQQKFLAKRKETLRKNTAELERVIAEEDFAPFLEEKAKEPIKDKELIELEARYNMKKREVRRLIESLRPKTGTDKAMEWLALPRAFMATADMSAVFRQCWILGTRHPIKFAGAIKDAFNAAIDPSGMNASEIMVALESSKNHLMRERAGLFLSTLDFGLTTSEEAFNSAAIDTFFQKTGALGKFTSVVMGASERNMVIMLNVMRCAAFDSFVEANPNLDMDSYKAFANYINIASGRGNMKGFEQAAQKLSSVFFSPRFAVSRIQAAPVAAYLAGIKPMIKSAKGELTEGDKIVAKEVGKILFGQVVGSTIMMGFALALGGSVGTDPEEPDFGLISIGDMRIDIWAGQGPGFRLLMKYAMSVYNVSQGYKPNVYVDQATLNTLVKYKLSPWVVGVWETVMGARMIDKSDVNPYRVWAEKLIPITVSNLVQNLEEGVGTPQMIGELMGEFFGLSVYNFADEGKKKRKKKRRRRDSTPFLNIQR